MLRQGKMRTAMQEFRQARDLDATSAGDVAPEVAAGIAELMRRVDSAGVDSILPAYLEVAGWDENLAPSAETLNSVCWWSTITGHWRPVAMICDAAVKASPDAGYIRDSRGLNRALNGDLMGAREDFQFFVTWAKHSPLYATQSAQRKGWIAALRAGRNPFTPQVLAHLRIE